MKTKNCTIAALFVLAGVTCASATTTIDFSNLGGANGDPYTGSTESGFTITTPTGTWQQGQLYGNPTPSIFAGPIGSPSDSSIQLVFSGGSFNFDSLQYSCNNGTGSYSIEGFSGASMLYDQTGTLNGVFGPYTFSLLTGLNPGVSIDRLVIDVNPTGGPSSINLDNIVLDTPVASAPDSGATILLLAGSLATLAWYRRTLAPVNR